jgi:hypothetical protein
MAWVGTADADNLPGDYTWRVLFRDTVNQSVITVDVTIRVIDTPPSHNAAGAQSGDGTQGNPYRHTFTRGDDGTKYAALFLVTDANTTQLIALGLVSKAPSNPGVQDFAFSVGAGVGGVTPSAMLTVFDAGQHAYQVQVNVGVHVIGVYIELTVANPPIGITTASLPAGEVGQTYAVSLGVFGSVGNTAFSLTSGTLPSGLSLQPDTGAITGTPLVAGTSAVTIQVEDASGAMAARLFQLSVADAAAPIPPLTSAPTIVRGEPGCVAGRAFAGFPVWPLMLVFVAGSMMKRRRQRLL